MKKIDYSKYTREDLEKIIEKQALEIAKHKENSKAEEKRINKLEGIIKKMEQEKKDWFGIESNAAAYSTAKQFQALEMERNEYKQLYENTRKSKSETISKLQEKLENTREKIHNERGAGRKGQYDEEKVKRIIAENKEKPLREIQKILLENNEKVSIMTVKKYRRI